MQYYVSFLNDVKREMISHTLENPKLECGGFLLGHLNINNEKTICEVENLYYERRCGTDCEFRFGLIYLIRALKEAETQKLEILGTYHSHGQYPATLSYIDHHNLQYYLGLNKVTMVYSPGYSQLIGEFLDDSGMSNKVKILTRY